MKKMKKLLFLLMFTFTVGIAVKAQDDKDKMKKTSTPVQKAIKLNIVVTDIPQSIRWI